MKALPGRIYSTTLKCWHLPNNEETILALNDIKEYLSYYHKSERKNKHVPLTEFDDTTLLALESFKDYLAQRRYAKNTINSYLQVLKVFANWLSRTKQKGITLEAVRLFNKEYFIDGDYSRSYQNIFINALKLYLIKIESTDIPFDMLERPRSSKYLPNVLSEDEVRVLISSYENIKHRAIIMCYYACGLRKSELIHLKLSDIDSQRMVVRIRNSKGAKDRDVSLPNALLELLRKYFDKYKPKEYLFNGKTNLKYSSRSIDNLIQQGVKRSGIKKKITTHSLRHSYATHLVEKNINLRYIQDALGHKSSKTTEIYTKLSKESIAKMVSPVDFWEDLG